jgi:hypothetical protein
MNLDTGEKDSLRLTDSRGLKSASTLLADLRRRGFSVGVEANGIRISPASQLTDADRQAIRAHKADLLAVLRDRAAIESMKGITVGTGTGIAIGIAAGPPASPPKDALLYCQDERGRPTGPETAWMWTWAGADCWHYANQHPVPAGHAVDGTRW